MLTPAQSKAVERTGQDVCVMAGPGSGKTTVLIERFAWLVEARQIEPARVLAITFTEKAATEIKQRLIDRFAKRPDLREQIERAWVSTIHGFCARLLRENAIAAGLAPDFAVLDQPAADRMAREAAEEALEILFQEQPDQVRRLLESLDLSTQDDGRVPDLARSLLSVYETMRLSGTRDFTTESPCADAYAEARDLSRAALSDLTTGRTEPQRIAHARLREWANAFLALPGDRLTLDHFERLRLDVHLNRLVLRSAARDAARELKNVVLPSLEAQLLETWNAASLAFLRAAISRMDSLYREKKRRDAALDFDDLEEEAIRLLESDPLVLRETAGRFDEVLMDELQDTNRLQWRLIDLIRKRLFAVGDINQSIYSFRHAEPAVFEEYRRGLIASGFEIDDLRENHRSFQEILDAVSRTLDGQPGIEPRPLLAVRGSGAMVERLAGCGEKGAEVEASLVAARIREMVDSRECDFREIAVLVRTMSAAEPFARAFERFGIPFLVSGGRTFLEARETRDLMALFAALVNPLDEVALVGVLRSPFCGMSDEQLFRIGRDVWREEFDKLFGPLRPLSGFIAPDLLLATALDECGYVANLPERARANVEKFLAYVRREHRSRPRPMAELLDDLEALRATQSEAEAPPPEAGDIVRLMSIHAAKGLEFKVVFVSALHQGPDRRKPVITLSRTAGLGAKWRNPASGKGQSDTAHALAIDELNQQEEAEENRLLYVAMTRAADRLILSYAERERASNWQKLAAAGVPTVIMAEQAPDPPTGATSAPSQQQPGEELLDPPAVTAQYDSTAAVTSVALFHACPRKYYLSSCTRAQVRAAGPGESHGETSGIAAGLAVHRILAGEMPVGEGSAELAARFTNSTLGQRAARANRIEREFDFLLYLEDVVLRGQIDLWFEESGQLIVVDYKTDRDELAAGPYALQLRLYALALEKYLGRLPDRAVLYYLRGDKAMDVSLDGQEMENARAAVRAFRGAQETLEYPLNAGEQCSRCQFFGNRCPAEPGA